MMRSTLKIFATILACSCLLAIGFSLLEGVEKSYKYKIRTENGLYRTNSYEKLDGDCIEFRNQCGCGGKSKGTKVRVCGNYSVETSN
jgi:hypothetical protein